MPWPAFFLLSTTFKTGVIVSDTNAEIKTATEITIPNSLNKLPTKPCKKITGRNTTANVIEVDTTTKNISLEPSIAAFRIGNPDSNFLKIFSVTTMPSSTTSPVASTIANNVRMLMLKPAKYITKKVAINEIGMSIKGRMAIKIFLKNKKMTITTRLNEINKVSATSRILFLTLTVLSISVVS